MLKKLTDLIQESITMSCTIRNEPAVTIFTEAVVLECFKAAMLESKNTLDPVNLLVAMKLRVGL